MSSTELCILSKYGIPRSLKRQLPVAMIRAAMSRVSLGLQVYKCCLHWGLKYTNRTYFVPRNMGSTLHWGPQLPCAMAEWAASLLLRCAALPVASSQSEHHHGLRFIVCVLLLMADMIAMIRLRWINRVHRFRIVGQSCRVAPI